MLFMAIATVLACLDLVTGRTRGVCVCHPQGTLQYLMVARRRSQSLMVRS